MLLIIPEEPEISLPQCSSTLLPQCPPGTNSHPLRDPDLYLTPRPAMNLEADQLEENLPRERPLSLDSRPPITSAHGTPVVRQIPTPNQPNTGSHTPLAGPEGTHSALGPGQSALATALQGSFGRSPATIWGHLLYDRFLPRRLALHCRGVVRKQHMDPSRVVLGRFLKGAHQRFTRTQGL